MWGSCSECGCKARPNAEKLQFPGGCVWAPQRIFSGLRFGVSPPRKRGSSTAFKVMLGFKFPSQAAYADIPLSPCRVIELNAHRRACRSSAKLRRSLPTLVGGKPPKLHAVSRHIPDQPKLSAAPGQPLGLAALRGQTRPERPPQSCGWRDGQPEWGSRVNIGVGMVDTT